MKICSFMCRQSTFYPTDRLYWTPKSVPWISPRAVLLFPQSSQQCHAFYNPLRPHLLHQVHHARQSPPLVSYARWCRKVLVTASVKSLEIPHMMFNYKRLQPRRITTGQVP